LMFGAGCVLLVTGEALLWVTSQLSPQVTSNLMQQHQRFWCCLGQFTLFVEIGCHGCVQCPFVQGGGGGGVSEKVKDVVANL
jgi:hypothetical protein